MQHDTLSHLAPDARDVVERYLEQIAAALATADPDEAAETIESLASHLAETLSPEADAAQACDAVAELGDPAEYGAVAEDAPAPAEKSSRAAGTILGVPYELRVPTSERAASRWWNPRDPQLFVPRVFGIGWDLNFGALAVRLGLIEPDAEDEPFGEVPFNGFVLALLVPVVFTSFVVVSYLASRESLPAQVPVHWDILGRPDRWGDVGSAAVLPLLTSAVATVLAVWNVLAGHRSPLTKGLWIAFASLMSAAGAAVWGLTLASIAGITGWWISPAVLALTVAAPLFVLTGLARTGRAAEVRNDVQARR